MIWAIGLSIRILLLLCLFEFVWSQAGIHLAKTAVEIALKLLQDRMVPYALEVARRMASKGDLQSFLHPLIAEEGNLTSTADPGYLSMHDIAASLESGATAVNVGLMVAGLIHRRFLRR